MDKASWEPWKQRLIVVRNDVKICPLCGHNVEDRTVTIYKELVYDLSKVYAWCKERNVHYFKMKDIKHILDKNNYARFGDLVRFGGLVFKYAKGNYGLNMDRCRAFFKGTYKIPVQITINQITGETVSKEEVDIKHFPELYRLLNPDGLYDPSMNLNYK